MAFLLVFLSSLFLAYLTYPSTVKLLERINLTKKNFRKKFIPTGSGVVFLWNLLLIGPSAVYFSVKENLLSLEGSGILFGFFGGIALLGFLDDLYGDTSIQGFEGHLRALAKGRLTTGILKAVGGGVLSLTLAVFLFANLIEILINASLLALTINFFNLLDLRPGRALKTFLLVGTFLFILTSSSFYWIFALLFYGGAAVLLRYDLTGESMLGDVGSNVLGAVTGVHFLINFDWDVNLVVLIVLFLLHLYAERYSFTKAIEKVFFLRWFDNLGRKG